jgi:hypothetical protein
LPGQESLPGRRASLRRRRSRAPAPILLQPRVGNGVERDHHPAGRLRARRRRHDHPRGASAFEGRRVIDAAVAVEVDLGEQGQRLEPAGTPPGQQEGHDRECFARPAGQGQGC